MVLDNAVTVAIYTSVLSLQCNGRFVVDTASKRPYESRRRGKVPGKKSEASMKLAIIRTPGIGQRTRRHVLGARREFRTR